MKKKEFYYFRYQVHARPLIKEILESLLDFTELAGKLGLDAGCGWGWFLHYAVKKSIDMYGFEVNLKSLKKALVFGVGTDRLLVSDVQCMPFRDEMFDFVICWHVIEHVPNPKKVLKEISRILKAGGVLVLGVPNEKTVTNLLFKPFRWLSQKGMDNYYINSLAFYDPTHLREYTCSYLLAILRKDFRVKKVRLDALTLPIFRIFGLVGVQPPQTKTLLRIAARLPYAFRRSIAVCAKKRERTFCQCA